MNYSQILGSLVASFFKTTNQFWQCRTVFTPEFSAALLRVGTFRHTFPLKLSFYFSKSGDRKKKMTWLQGQQKPEHYRLVFTFMEKSKRKKLLQASSCHKSYYFVACKFLPEQHKFRRGQTHDGHSLIYLDSVWFFLYYQTTIKS